MADQEKDELWDLLGKASHPKAVPSFSDQVLSRIREEIRGTAGRKPIPLPVRILLPLAACCAFGLFLATRSQPPAQPNLVPAVVDGRPMMIPEEFHQEVEMSRITYMETLLSEEDTYLLADNDLVALFSE